jgi:DNA polymerase-4
VILLVDMDAFFASVEQMRHPNLRGQPVIVCGDPQRRGVVTAASYEARPSGVRAGMPLQEARRLCPEAHYVEGNPETYVALSLKLLDLYLSYTPDVEPFSVDEAFLGFQGARDSLEHATGIAREIQAAIEQRFQLGATIGVGPSKLIAKMASGVQKPRGITAFDVEAFQRHFWPLEVQQLWGVGPQLATRMRSLGIQTVGELAHASIETLKAAFGIIGPQMHEAAHGHDDTPLVPYHQGVDSKSMGHEVTLSTDCLDPVYLESMLLRLSDQVGRRLRGEGYVGRTVCLKLRNGSFETRMRQTTLPHFTADHRLIFETATRLLQEVWKGDPVRLIGVSLSGLGRLERNDQSELFTTHDRQQRLRDALDRVRDKLGEASLVPAGTLTNRSRMSHVPFGPISSRPRAPGPGSKRQDWRRGDPQ